MSRSNLNPWRMLDRNTQTVKKNANFSETVQDFGKFFFLGWGWGGGKKNFLWGIWPPFSMFSGVLLPSFAG